MAGTQLPHDLHLVDDGTVAVVDESTLVVPTHPGFPLPQVCVCLLFVCLRVPTLHATSVYVVHHSSCIFFSHVHGIKHTHISVLCSLRRGNHPPTCSLWPNWASCPPHLWLYHRTASSRSTSSRSCCCVLLETARCPMGE